MENMEILEKSKKPIERIDDLHRNGYVIIQDPEKFCFGVDAVLLSDFAKAKKNEVVLDLGTGTGIIPILVAAKTNAKKIIGLEIQSQCVEMARRSVAMNDLQERISIDQGDIKNLTQLYKPSSINVITTNPPYIHKSGGIINEYDSKAIARHELLCTLDDIVAGSSKLLTFGGRFYMIHRPYRLVDIFTTMRIHNIEPKVIRFVHPFAHKDPTMVLVEGIRSGKAELKVMPPLIIYESQGVYTEEVRKIYYE